MHIVWLGHAGSGRTTLAALLARAFAERGARVLAVDAASRPRLAARLGLRGQGRIGSWTPGDAPVAPRLRPVQRGSDLAGAFSGTVLAASLQVLQLHASHVEAATPGGPAAHAAGAALPCACAADGAERLRESIAAFAPAQVVCDFDAGLAPLTRGEVDPRARTIVVVEPYRRALDVAARLAAALRERPHAAAGAAGEATGPWLVVANKVQHDDDRAAVEVFCRRHDLPLHAWVGFDAALPDAPASLPAASAAYAAVRELAARLPA